MIALLISTVIAIVPTDPGIAAHVQRYRECVLREADRYHHGDLSAEAPSDITFAATVACRGPRNALIDAAQLMLKTRTPAPSEGMINGAVAILLVREDGTLDRQIERRVIEDAAVYRPDETGQ